MEEQLARLFVRLRWLPDVREAIFHQKSQKMACVSLIGLLFAWLRAVDRSRITQQQLVASTTNH